MLKMAEKNRFPIAKLHFILVSLVAIVNLVGIFSRMYENVFVFFIVSVLNIVTVSILILHLLKYSDDKRYRKLSMINLLMAGGLAIISFFRYIYLLAY